MTSSVRTHMASYVPTSRAVSRKNVNIFFTIGVKPDKSCKKLINNGLSCYYLILSVLENYATNQSLFRLTKKNKI